MIPVSTAEKIFGKNLIFVSTFLDKYKSNKTKVEKHKTKMTKLQK